MSALSGSLSQSPLSPSIRNTIRQSLWPISPLGKKEQHALDWRPYFVYYERQCHDALHEQGANVLVRTHEHIIGIVAQLQQGHHRATIKQDLRTLVTSKEKMRNEEEILDNSIDLAVRLCIMVHVGSNQATIIRGAKLLWSDSTIQACLWAHFTERKKLGDSKIQFEKTFTAANIERIADMKICWTNNFADHLRMVNDDDRTVAIFHHASFLECQRDNPLFPEGLVVETLHTLALLFTTHDKNQTQKWFKALPPSEFVDQYLMQIETLNIANRQIETFHYWHDRLIMLKQAFDDSSPVKMSQWWYDRRNGYMLYTFWVAVFVLVLTVFFGLIQSIEGALQVYKAYHHTVV